MKLVFCTALYTKRSIAFCDMFVGFFSDFANFWQKYKSLPEGMWNKHTYMYSLQRTAYHMSFYMFVLYRV